MPDADVKNKTDGQNRRYGGSGTVKQKGTRMKAIKQRKDIRIGQSLCHEGFLKTLDRPRMQSHSRYIRLSVQ